MIKFSPLLQNLKTLKICLSPQMIGNAVYLYSLFCWTSFLMTLLAEAGKGVGGINLVLPRKGEECCLTANVYGAWLSRAFLWYQSLAGGWWLWLCEGLGVSKQENRNEGMGENFSRMQNRQLMTGCCFSLSLLLDFQIIF